MDFVPSDMKGDLSTLKKVCKYASAVMLIGEFVFAALVIATIAMGIAAQFSDSWRDIFIDWVSAKDYNDPLKTTSSFIVTTLIYVLGFITVWMVHDLMVSIKTEYSPFVPENAKRIKTISMAFLFASVFLLVFGILAGKGITEIAFLFFGSLMVAVVMYCLTIVCRYGTLLQKESDETL